MALRTTRDINYILNIKQNEQQFGAGHFPNVATAASLNLAAIAPSAMLIFDIPSFTEFMRPTFAIFEP